MNKKILLILILAITILPSGSSFTKYMSVCWDLTNGVPCINGTTTNMTLQGFKINWSDILNPQVPAGTFVYANYFDQFLNKTSNVTYSRTNVSDLFIRSLTTSSCDVKAYSENGSLYCGTDATGAGGGGIISLYSTNSYIIVQNGTGTNVSANLTAFDLRYLQSYTETDPVFLANNASIYAALFLRLNRTDQQYNETLMVQAVNSTANTKAFPGTCAPGTVTANTTTSGVQCVAVGGGTDLWSSNITTLNSANVSTNLRIDNLLTRYFYANTSDNYTGITNATVNVTFAIDTNYLNLSEVAAGFNLTINFTQVNLSFNGLDLREQFSANTESTLTVQIFNWNTTAWDDLLYIGSQTTFQNTRLSIYNVSRYVNTTLVNLTRIRFVAQTPLNIADVLYIDYLALNYQAVDNPSQLSGSGKTKYLPLWLDSGSLGSSLLNQTLGALYISSNITANRFFGNLDWSYVTSRPDSVNLDWVNNSAVMTTDLILNASGGLNVTGLSFLTGNVTIDNTANIKLEVDGTFNATGNVSFGSGNVSLEIFTNGTHVFLNTSLSIVFPSLSGAGNQNACLDATGRLYRAAACV